MRNRHSERGFTPRHKGVLILALALLLGACDNDVDVTGPELPDWTPLPADFQSFRVFGTLTAEEGSCQEATILYDGRELAFARATCERPSGCAELGLYAGSVAVRPGHHTIALRVLRQSPDAVRYLAEAELLIETLDGREERRSLGTRRVTLEAGQSAVFGVDF